VILEDATAQNPFSADQYIRQKRARSVLCLPLVKQAKLIGMLYLENNLASHVFTPARISVLELLSSQAAISIENARLYAELITENRDRKEAERALRASQERWRNLFENAPVGVALRGWHGRYVAANPAFQRMTGYSEAELRVRSPADITHEADRAALDAVIAGLTVREPDAQRVEMRYRRKDGGVTCADVSAFVVQIAGSTPLFAAVAVDITDRKRAEDSLRRSEASLSKAQAELAHVTRVTALGELAASIAHEINQPLGAIVADANAGLNWLAAEPPNIAGIHESLAAIVNDGERAANVLTRIRTLLARSSPARGPCELAGLVRDVLALVNADLARHTVSIQASLPETLPLVLADRVQLQQVLLNLILNAAEASRDLPSERRRLLVRGSAQEDKDGQWVIVAVRDAGVGLPESDPERLFEAFYTTKPNGLGMGLSISRSIIDAHGGLLWATPNQDHGATFQFSLPVVR
jgi:PAS domain S-box-containing protein